MHCLVTGASGFIGRHLTSALRAAGHTVRAAGRRPLALGENVGWVPFDLTQPAADWASLIAGCSVVYHLAWTSLPATSNRDPLADARDNLLPGLGLLEAAQGHPGLRIVFVSSGGTVYGPARATPIPEAHPAAPICAYGLSKLTFERYLALYRSLHGMDYRVLRVANAFGTGQDTSRQQGAVTTFLRDALAGRAIRIWGDGSVVRDYVHVADVVSALIRAGELRAGERGAGEGSEARVYNIGSGRGRSLNDIVAALRGIGLAVRVDYQPARTFDVQANVLDVSLAARILDWSPRVKFEDAIQVMAEDLGFGRQGMAAPVRTAAE